MTFGAGRTLPRATGKRSPRVVAIVLCPKLLDALHFTKYSCTIAGEVFLGNGHETNHSTFRWNGEHISHKGLDECGVAFVGRGANLRRQSGDGENVSGFERASIQ